jgi:hypothetical protein
MARLTFPDQQQDSQNAAGDRIAGECDGSVKFARLVVETDSGAIWLPDGVRAGTGVSEARAAFVTNPATGYWEPLRSLKSQLPQGSI